MKAFPEQNILFIFDDDWVCEKWDDHATYRKGIGKLRGTQAVDFLGVCDSAIYLIEVKDFRGHRIDGKDKAHWSDEVACKVRDTLAGIVGAAISGEPREDIVACCVDVLEGRDRNKVHVVAWILEDEQRSHPDHRKRNSQLSVKQKESAQWRKMLEKRLEWLTPKVKHANPFEHPRVPGVTVQNLPRNDGNGAATTAQPDDRLRRTGLIQKIRNVEAECREMAISLDAPVRRGLDVLVERIKAE